MSPVVLLPLSFALSYIGVYMLSRPSDAIQRIMTFVKQLDEFEAVLTRQPLCEPIQLDESPRTQVCIRVFGLAITVGALVQAAISLDTLQ